MFKLRYPLSRKFMYNSNVLKLTQLFGDNKNRKGYGAMGHRGIDVKTRANWKYTRDSRQSSGWRAIARDDQEKRGRIQITAAHSGTLRTVLYDDKQGLGWGVYVTKEVEREDGKEVQYRTLYWHIETPWGSLKNFAGKIKPILQLKALFTGKKVRAGAIIAVGGNNGMSSGPHLHLALDRREKMFGIWTEWNRINPMPYFQSPGIVAECNYLYDWSIVDNSKLYNSTMYSTTYWYKGEQISKAHKNNLLK